MKTANPDLLTWLFAMACGVIFAIAVLWVTALLVPKPGPMPKQPCTTDAHCEQMFASR